LITIASLAVDLFDRQLKDLLPCIPLSPASGGIFNMKWRGVHPEGIHPEGDKRG